MDQNDASPVRLSAGALVIERLVRQKMDAGDGVPCLRHWLSVVLTRHGPMAQSMATHLDAAGLARETAAQLDRGDAGDPLTFEAVYAAALEHAEARGLATANERDITAAVLRAAGIECVEPAVDPIAAEVASTAGPIAAAEVAPATNPIAAAEVAPAAGHMEAPVVAPTAGHIAAAEVAAAPEPGTDMALAESGADLAAWRPRTSHHTPFLERFGRDITREANAGKLPPFIGREEEIALIIETLCRRTKRNPVLVGPAGTGKTAMVEAFAQRVVRGEVPGLLQNHRVIAIQPFSLTAGARENELQVRMEALLDEARNNEVILFIDEVHAIVGAGGRPGVNDIASLLKPALARGELACIAATTEDEYRRFIEADPALDRRFQPLRVREMTAEEALQVLERLRAAVQTSQGVSMGDDVLRMLVKCAERYLQSRHFPDKAIDLFEQCVAHAVATGRTELSRQDALEVIQRLVGMPLSLETRVATLQDRIEELQLLQFNECKLLLQRIKITFAGFDMHTERPNCVVLLSETAASRAEELALLLASTLYGDAERVVRIDFGRFTEAQHLSMFTGASPGLVGYGDTLPIHQIARTPWCVLLCENVECAHPTIRAALTQAMRSGVLTDSAGRRIYLSDCLALLSARLSAEGDTRVGIRHRSEGDEPSAALRAAAERALGKPLAEEVDLILVGSGVSDAGRREEAGDRLLADLSRRFLEMGVKLHWDDSARDWLMRRAGQGADARRWERLLDEEIGPLLYPYLSAGSDGVPCSITVKTVDDVPAAIPDNADCPDASPGK